MRIFFLTLKEKEFAVIYSHMVLNAKFIMMHTNLMLFILLSNAA